MTERTDPETASAPAGDRRFPVPLWRRPWALVAYGVLGALLLVLLFNLGGEEEEAPAAQLDVTTAAAPPVVDPAAPPAAGAAPRDAFGVGDYERLLAEGDAARGQLVRTLLYCQGTTQVALRDVDRVSRSVAGLADAQRRVPAAECRWSADENAPEFLLLVPPALASRFAAMPEVEQGFIRRRRVPAELEWVGTSEALALRTAGVLRAVQTE